MGRLFDTTSKTSNVPKSTSGKGRLFTTPVKKATLGEKVEKTAKGITKFVGGEKLSEAIGGTIAINKALKEGKQQEAGFIGETLPTNKQTLASIGEVALNVVPLGVGLGAGAKTATKLATSIPRLAAEGAAYGTAQGGLRAVQEGADVFSKETLKQSAVGGAIGGLAGGVIGAVGTVGRIFKNKKTPQQLFEEATQRANFKPIPDVGTPFDNIKPKTGIFDNGFTNLPKQTADINIQPGARWITPNVVAKTALEARALNNPNMSDFIGQEIQALQKTGQKVPVNTNKLATKAWEKMHPAPVQETIPKIKKVKTTEPNIETPTVTQVAPEQIKTEAPKVNKEPIVTPETITKEQSSKFDDMFGEPKSEQDRIYQKTTIPKLINTVNELEAVHGVDTLSDAILRGDVNGIIPQGFPPEAIRQSLLLKKNLTFDQRYRLVSGYTTASEAGLNLKATQIGENNIFNSADDFVEAYNAKLKLDLKNKTITKKTILNLLDDMQCPL